MRYFFVLDSEATKNAIRIPVAFLSRDGLHATVNVFESIQARLGPEHDVAAVSAVAAVRTVELLVNHRRESDDAVTTVAANELMDRRNLDSINDKKQQTPRPNIHSTPTLSGFFHTS